MVLVCIEEVSVSHLLQKLRPVFEPDKSTPQLPQYLFKIIVNIIFLCTPESIRCLWIPLPTRTGYMFSHPLLHGLIILKWQWRGSGPLSPKPGFDLMPACVGFVVDILWMSQGVLRALRSALFSASPPLLHTAVRIAHSQCLSTIAPHCWSVCMSPTLNNVSCWQRR
jgi:hypothetical protein